MPGTNLGVARAIAVGALALTRRLFIVLNDRELTLEDPGP
jgi:hypothetical protein